MADLDKLAKEVTTGISEIDGSFEQAAFAGDTFEIPGIEAFGDLLGATEEVLRPSEEPSFTQEIVKGLGRGFRTPADIAADTLFTLGIEEPREFLKETGAFLTPSEKASRSQAIAGEIASGVGQMISLIGTFGRSGTLKGMGISSGTSKTRQLLEEGESLPVALGVGAANAVLTIGTEYAPLASLFKKDIGFAKRLLTTTISDIIGEEAETFGEKGIASLVLDKPFPTIEESKELALNTALVSLGVSGIMSTGVSLAEKGLPPSEPIKSEPEAELALDIDKKTPKPSIIAQDLNPTDKPDSFENERAIPDLGENAKIEKAIREQPKTDFKTANKEYKRLVDEGLINERSDKDIGTIIPKIQFPHTLAKQQPKFKPIYERGLEFVADVDRRIGGYAEILTPYLNVDNKSKAIIDEIKLEEHIERNDIPYSDIELAQRLNPEELEAYNAYTTTMVKAADDIKTHLIKMGNDPIVVDEFIQRLSPTTYAPLKRHGDYFVAVKDRRGEVIHYQHYKNKKSMRADAIKFKGKGLVETGKVKKVSDEVINEVPVNILSFLGEVDKKTGAEISKLYGDVLQKGFPKHLIESKKTPGFDSNLAAPTSEYLMGISKWIARREARVDFAQQLSNIDPKVESNLFTESKKYIDYVTGSTNELSKFRQWMFRYYLGGNVKSALVNATQTLTSTFPVLSKYTSNPSIKIGKAINIANKSLANINKTDQDLADALRQGIFDGVINEQMVTMLRGEAFRGMDLNKLDNALSFFFNHVETFNRKVAFIAAYKSGRDGVRIKDFDGKKRKVKLSHEEAIKFGEDFVRETQFEYSKADRPPIARGKAAPAFTFRIFAGNYMSMLKNFLGEREFGAMARSLGIMLALGGVKAIPGAKDLVKVLELFGYDPDKVVRDTTGKYGDLALHGVLAPFGVDISGAIGAMEVVPNDIQQGAWPAVASIILGVPTDLPKRISRSIYFAKDLRDPWRAVEAIMPEAVRNPMVAARWYKEGAARTPLGEPIADPKAFDIVLKALSIQPTMLTKAYEREHSERLLTDRARESSANISFRIARAIFNEDDQGLEDIFKSISEHNENVDSPEEFIIVNEQSVKQALSNMIYPEAVELKRLPKKARQEYFNIQETFGQ